MSKPYFNKVTILGVGLIGGSFAMSLRKNGLCGEITGYGRNRENLETAMTRGIIDSFTTDPASSCSEADLVFFSTPVGSILALAKMTAPYLKKGALVTDGGSVKAALVYEMEKLMPDSVDYVGGHPIAGSDRSGIDAASAGLFRNAKCILTPTTGTNESATVRLADMWTGLGARVITMSPDRHDRIYASVSHLPHLLAYALVNAVADMDPEFLGFSGQGFIDMTRLASSSQEIWRDICVMNRDNLLETVSVFQKTLDALTAHLEQNDASSLEREFGNARELREKIGQN